MMNSIILFPFEKYFLNITYKKVAKTKKTTTTTLIIFIFGILKNQKIRL